jgi:arylformamidase
MQVVDLTHPISPEMPVYFPWHPSTNVEQTATYGEHQCEVRRLSIGSHTGTHIDAPSHVFAGMPALDSYDPRLWVQSATVLDFTPRQPRETITQEDMQKKKLCRGRAVVIKTGWDRQFGRDDYYETYPPIANEAAEFLVEMDVPLVAADTPFTFDVHKILLRKGIPLVTNINNTSLLKEGEITLISAPLLVRGGDGAPARVLAIVGE